MNVSTTHNFANSTGRQGAWTSDLHFRKRWKPGEIL